MLCEVLLVCYWKVRVFSVIGFAIKFDEDDEEGKAYDVGDGDYSGGAGTALGARARVGATPPSCSFR